MYRNDIYKIGSSNKNEIEKLQWIGIQGSTELEYIKSQAELSRYNSTV